MNRVSFHLDKPIWKVQTRVKSFKSFHVEIQIKLVSQLWSWEVIMQWNNFQKTSHNLCLSQRYVLFILILFPDKIHWTPSFNEQNVFLFIYLFSVYKNYEEKSCHLYYFEIHLSIRVSRGLNVFKLPDFYLSLFILVGSMQIWKSRSSD